jgi:hypothetical protein
MIKSGLFIFQLLSEIIENEDRPEQFLEPQVNQSDNESDRILLNPTIRRKSYRNSGHDPRDGSIVLDPIGSDSKIR